MTKNRKRIPLYVTDIEHRNIKTYCATKGISMNYFILKLIDKEISKKFKAKEVK